MSQVHNCRASEAALWSSLRQEFREPPKMRV